MNIKITKEQVGKALKIGGMVFAYGAVCWLNSRETKGLIDEVRYSGIVSYSDAVNVIMDSNLFDSNKMKAIELLKKTAGSEYYKTIIKIVKSDMFDSNKIKTIAQLSEEES